MLRYSQFWKEPLEVRLASCWSRPRRGSTISNNHQHAFFELGMVTTGACDWVLQGGRRCSLKQGEFILFPPGTMHREEVSGPEGTTLSFVGFDWKLSPGMELPEGLLSRPLEAGEHAEGIRELLWKIYEEFPSTRLGAADCMEFALRQMLILVFRTVFPDQAARASGKKSDLSDRQVAIARSAAQHLRQNFAQPVTVAQVARYHSLCPPYFSTLFRRYHRLSPQAFLQKVRMERARELLADDLLSVKSIAHRLGYVDAAHFCKRFKQVTRMTPKGYRQTLLMKRR